MAKSAAVEPISNNRITNGTTITGDITSNNDIRIDGVLIGNLVTKGKLVVGQSGEIKGEITCSNSDVEGMIEGKIIVSELLKLSATSKVIGDVVTNKLAIEAGAIFTGTCSMKDSEVKTIEKKK